MNISVCIITKNEIGKLKRCLDALSGYPFEIVVVDTGSTDGTRELIKKRADVTGDFAWVDDFSEARNYSISLAQNDWILVLDTDEYVTDIELPALERFINESEDRVGRIKRVNHIENEKSADKYELSCERISRLFNRKYFKYRGRIHEQIVGENGYDTDHYDVPITVEHDGYVGDEDALASKAERNISLLMLDLEEYGDDPYTLYQLGKSFFMVKDFERAFEFFARGLEFDLNPGLEYVQDMLETYGYTLLELGRYEDMLLLENVYDVLCHSADYVFLMGLAYMNNGLFDRAIEEFCKATEISSCKVEGCNSYKAYFNAGVIKECLGRTDEAMELYEKCGDYAPAKEGMIRIFCPHEDENKVKSSAGVKAQDGAISDAKKKEVVFFPYKASMWDSLEGEYNKAIADKNCVVHVIPIPYFDKTPDGSFGQMHWEIEDYPENISTEDYRGYDVKAHHPSEIYIHNPYDEGNHVTSVHPYYYSKNLKNFTDKLIYIPYFVMEEIDSSNSDVVKNLSHLAQVSAVINANEVVVQSENIKKFYVESMVLAGGESLRDYFEKKIVVRPSSKLDKVINSKMDDFAIPKEWERILLKDDGSRRKVILYNTSVTAFLNDSEKMLRKIKWALSVFRDNAENVALLWRPHPLMEATVKSMRPELWEAYSSIVEQYRREAWGIYDNTPDLDRAIFVSDAYYGDGSSLVTMCKTRGMPIMIQNVDILQ